MAIEYARDRQTASASVRLVVAGLVGVAAGVAAGRGFAWHLAPLFAWDAGAIVYLGWMWLTIANLDGDKTSDFALREDPARGIADFLLLAASIVSLAAVGLVLLSGSSSNTNETVIRAALSVFSVVLAWLLTHTIFMLRYAEMYYGGEEGGVGFDGTRKPTFSDFAYLSFTLGMTFQVSDTGFKSTEFRALALRHALMSYLFGTVIVATTINLVAGLSK